MGLNVIAIDIHEPQLALAKQFKADMVINAALEDPVARVLSETWNCIIGGSATR